jgi:hypothetical protein
MGKKIDWKLFNEATATIPSLCVGEEKRLTPETILCINEALQQIKSQADAVRIAFDKVRGGF